MLGSTSGYAELAPSAVAGDQTFTLPGTGGTLVTTSGTQTLTNKTIQGGGITSGTSVASTSGTSIDFTGIPSWVKRVTVMFSGVSLSSNAALLVQIGSGSVTSSGYLSSSSYVSHQFTNTTSGTNNTSGYVVLANNASSVVDGMLIIALQTGNTYVSSHVAATRAAGLGAIVFGAGTVSLSGALDRVRVTSTSTDTFDAGTINILYEG
ncbi:MAG: hypothetical protein FJ077_12855 [Cyanobacteria bacterium K_DeepCast_35m_m2_023]|nr:hypothetical protein [Cyanobacteria bacterium K_DeepCast_35m_m2_023]